MTGTILGDEHILVIQGRQGTYTFWAERGMIRCQTSWDGKYKILSVEQFRPRVKALREMLTNSKGKFGKGLDAHAATMLARDVRAAENIVAKATEQGSPNNPEAVAEANRRAPVMFVMGATPALI